MSADNYTSFPPGTRVLDDRMSPLRSPVYKI